MASEKPLGYCALEREGVYEETINKSRFIGYASPALEEEDALSYLQEIQKRHPDASCICHAYVSGLSGAIQRFYDGHEPVGGMPILDAIRKRGVTGSVCAVVRYFGGVKLGMGGLARAFGNVAIAAVDAARSYLGGAILPGIRASAALFKETTSLLPAIALGDGEEGCLGRNSADAMRCGLLLGSAMMVDGFVGRYRALTGMEGAAVVATGGAAELITTSCSSATTVDRDLTLKGLRLLWENNRPRKQG